MAVCCSRNFEKDSFVWKLKGLVPLLIAESDWRATNPPFMPAISPNTSNQNFEIAILFSDGIRSGNYVFVDNNPPLQPPWQGL